MNSKVFAACLGVLVLAQAAHGAVYNAYCTDNETCHQLYTKSYNCEHEHCIREHFSFNGAEIFGIIMITFISMVANAGGLGAGAVIIPVYMFIYDFSATDSIPLSKITIFAGALINLVLMFNERNHKKKNRFLINYNLAAVIVPLLLAGTQIGVILSKFLPPFIVIGGLVSYLFFSMTKMYDRGKKEWAKEQAAEAQETVGKDIKASMMPIGDTSAEINTSTDRPTEIVEQSPEMPTNQDPNTFEIETVDTATRIGAKESDDEDLPIIIMFSRQYSNIGYMVLALGVVVMVALLRGGEGSKSIIGIDKCSSSSMGLFIFSQIAAVLISRKAYHDNKDVLDEDDKEDNGEVNLQERNRFLFMSYFTGIAAGSLGIGGGMILGPYMLALGMDAQMSTALSGFIVVFTSSSTTIQFTIAGAIHARHAYLFMIFSLIGSAGGNLILKRIVKKYNRPSLLVWVVFSILALASVILPAQMLYNTYLYPQNAFKFGILC